MNYVSEQEKFWAGEFGQGYIDRNNDSQLIANNKQIFNKIFKNISMPVGSIMEIGANIGLNLLAIKNLLPDSKFSAIEINPLAAVELNKSKFIDVHNESILNFKNNGMQYDFVFTKGVLIHINPDFLDQVYEKMYQMSSRYICVIEYYNPTPVTINYRGHQDKLFKRDFAGDLLDRYSDLSLVDYGFVYHRDAYPQDDLTWMLLKKN